MFSGPAYRSHEVRNARVILDFDHVGGGLVAGGEGAVHGFVIAGADHTFVPATAVVADNRVEVWSDLVPEPAAVRYAWSDNPEEANLRNAEGLPASPFRTDAW